MSLPNGVKREAGSGGLERIVVERPSVSGEIYLQGATVTGFTPAGHDPVLFVSERANYRAGGAIRGGVPLCFPWFGPKRDDPSAPQHGYARTSLWRLTDVREDGDTIEVELALSHDSKCGLRYTVRFGEKLDLALVVENCQTTPFSFEVALHAYFAVKDIERVEIRGLADADYIDKVASGARKREAKGPIRIEGETDRVYVGVSRGVELVDAAAARRITLQTDGLRSLVVWNPWITKSAAMKDFGDDEWKRMVCLEPANAADDTVLLAPAQTHTMRTRIVVNRGV